MMYMKVVSLGRMRAEGGGGGGRGEGEGGRQVFITQRPQVRTTRLTAATNSWYACSERLHTTHEYSISDVHIEGSTNWLTKLEGGLVGTYVVSGTGKALSD